MRSQFVRSRRGPGSSNEGSDSSVDLTGLVDSHRERDPAVASAFGLGDRSDETVAIDSLQRCTRRQPAPAQRLGQEEELVAEPIGDFACEIGVVGCERVGFSAGQILWPQPLVVAQVVDPTDPHRHESEPGEVEGVDHDAEFGVALHESRLELELLHAGNRREIALDQQPIADRGTGSEVLPGANRMGVQIRHDRDRGALTVIHDRHRRDDGTAVGVDGGERSMRRFEQRRSCPLGEGRFKHMVKIDRSRWRLEPLRPAADDRAIIRRTQPPRVA